MKTKKIVVIGGGSGVPYLLGGLKKYPVRLSAIVSMADSGGSSGKLRKELGVLPPGDARRALTVLSRAQKPLLDLFNYRFQKGQLAGHNFGNIFISVLEKTTGSFEKAIGITGDILRAEGEVLPSTLQKTDLFAVLQGGKIIKGETSVDIPKHNPELKIKRVYLKPNVSANKKAVRAIEKADLIVLGPGDLYTSLIPNLLVKRIPEAIKKSRAKKVFICNLMTKRGETNNFLASDFTNEIEKYLGQRLDYAIYNTKIPSPKRLAEYKKKHPELLNLVKFDKRLIKDKKFIGKDVLTKSGDIVHNLEKLIKIILSI